MSDRFGETAMQHAADDERQKRAGSVDPDATVVGGGEPPFAVALENDRKDLEADIVLKGLSRVSRKCAE